ncbi:MAG: zinc ribbon domain-containing protein [Methanobacteriota archaeon]|nr:MAG: zinc ribbon domain-containing protein [Euryarchaeota archaeon]
MNYCGKCGKPLSSADSNFCTKCGTKLQVSSSVFISDETNILILPPHLVKTRYIDLH